MGYNVVANGPFGYAFPAGVDPAIKERLENALADGVAADGVRKQMDDLGIEQVWRTGNEYGALLKSIETELVPMLRETGMAKKSAWPAMRNEAPRPDGTDH